MAEEDSPPKPKKKRSFKGLFKFLTILVVIVGTVAGTSIVLDRLSQPKPAAPKEGEAEAEGTEGHAAASGHGAQRR